MSLTDVSDTGPRQQVPRHTRSSEEAGRTEEADTKSNIAAGSLGEPSCTRGRCQHRDEELQLKRMLSDIGRRLEISGRIRTRPTRTLPFA
jgi:hypothetical protein